MKKLVTLICLILAIAYSSLSFADKGEDFSRALMDQDIAKVRTLITEGADVNTAILKGTQTPLHWAAFTNDADLANLLIEKGAKVNAKNPEGITPLYTATAKGSVKVLKVLLDKGANVNVRSKEGLTPLGLANKNQNKVKFKEIVELLESKGATE